MLRSIYARFSPTKSFPNKYLPIFQFVSLQLPPLLVCLDTLSFTFKYLSIYFSLSIFTTLKLVFSGSPFQPRMFLEYICIYYNHIGRTRLLFHSSYFLIRRVLCCSPFLFFLCRKITFTSFILSYNLFRFCYQPFS